MKEIDFLPRSFYDAWIRRRQTQRNVCLCVVLAISLGLLHFTTAARVRKAEAALAGFHAQMGEHQSERSRVEALHARKQLLEAHAALISELDDDAPVDAVIGTVTQLMTESMALRGITLQVQPAAGNDPGKPGVPDAIGGKPVDFVTSRGRTELVLSGVAATDVEVGIFFGKLAASPFFEDVRLMYSRDAEQAGRQMREFELRSLVKRVSIVK
jgi:hypothetical protein